MAWSTPSTWVAGAVLTAAQLNQQLRDNLNAAFPLGAPDAAWTGYTPTLTQSATVTKTATYAKYTRVGRTIVVEFSLAVTGAGTAANNVLIGLPVAAANTAGFLALGSGFILDTSATLIYPAIARINDANTVHLLAATTTTPSVLGSAIFTAALAAGDVVSASLAYEAAT